MIQEEPNSEVIIIRDPIDVHQCILFIQNKKILNGYKILKNIGQGAYGKIKLVQRMSDKKYFAIKKFNKFILRRKNKIFRNPDGSKKLFLKKNSYQICQSVE